MRIARIWRTNLAPDRTDEYEQFAREISLPMFRLQQGFSGALMLRDGANCLVITFWRGQDDIVALAKSDSYNNTVQSILARGFLLGEQTTETYGVHLSWLSELTSPTRSNVL